MITLLFSIGEQCWVPLPLCCFDSARFLEVVGLSLEILIFVGQFFYYRHHFLLVTASLVLLATSCSSTDVLLVEAAVRL